MSTEPLPLQARENPNSIAYWFRALQFTLRSQFAGKMPVNVRNTRYDVTSPRTNHVYFASEGSPRFVDWILGFEEPGVWSVRAVVRAHNPAQAPKCHASHIIDHTDPPMHSIKEFVRFVAQVSTTLLTNADAPRRPGQPPALRGW